MIEIIKKTIKELPIKSRLYPEIKFMYRTRFVNFVVYCKYTLVLKQTKILGSVLI